MFERLFLTHPRSMGETYGEHLQTAWGFGSSLIWAGLACILHGLVPALCTTTASRSVTALHERMVLNRRRRAAGDRGIRRA